MPSVFFFFFSPPSLAWGACLSPPGLTLPAPFRPSFSLCQDDTYTESYISTIGVDFVSPFFEREKRGGMRPLSQTRGPWPACACAHPPSLISFPHPSAPPPLRPSPTENPDGRAGRQGHQAPDCAWSPRPWACGWGRRGRGRPRHTTPAHPAPSHLPTLSLFSLLSLSTSGTRPARSGSGRSPRPTTGAPTASSCVCFGREKRGGETKKGKRASGGRARARARAPLPLFLTLPSYSVSVSPLLPGRLRRDRPRIL